MRKALFILVYFALPVLPAALYVYASGGGTGTYPASVALGAYAFSLFCGQLALAAKPGLVVKTLGLKGTIALHSAAPIAALAIALTHRQLKELSGFDVETVQTAFGSVALITLALASALGILFLANFKGQLGAGLRKFRSWADKALRLGYKRSRALHALSAIALAALAAHAALASTSSLGVNPAGLAILGAYFIAAEALFIRYRVKGRPNPK